MTEQHPITPPPELVQQWLGEHFGTTVTGEISDVELHLATQAARWGADQELEACCEWLEDHDCEDPQEAAEHLRSARRPKPPSLKEQALEAMSRFDGEMWCSEMEADLAVIRTALEQLDD